MITNSGEGNSELDARTQSQLKQEANPESKEAILGIAGHC